MKFELNSDTVKEIIAKKEERSGKRLFPEEVDVRFVKLRPRFTLCIIDTPEEQFFGISLRSKHDKDTPEVGKVVAFVRALEAIAECQP